MKRYFSILLVLLLGCSEAPETMIEHLTGYWEINKVILSDGQERDYTVNLTIDYIQVNEDLSGFRKKLKPGFEGNFETSKDQERLKVEVVDNKLLIHYSTALSSWTEEVIKANEEELQVINDQNTTYLYKRYQPIDITE